MSILRTASALAIACSLFSAAPALAEPPQSAAEKAKIADIRKLLDLTGAGALGQQVLTQLMGSFKQSMPNVPEKFWSDFAKEAHPEDLVNLTVPIYAKYLTHEEVKSIIAFYQTPAGKKLVAVLPQVTQESMVVGQQWGRQLGERIAKKLQEQGSK